VSRTPSSLSLHPGEKKFLATVGAVVLGTAVLGFAIVDHNWRREKAHDLAMSGRGTYR
jgi:hypothetical protein